MQPPPGGGHHGYNQFALEQQDRTVKYHAQDEEGKNTQIIITLNHNPNAYLVNGPDGAAHHYKNDKKKKPGYKKQTESYHGSKYNEKTNEVQSDAAGGSGGGYGKRRPTQRPRPVRPVGPPAPPRPAQQVRVVFVNATSMCRVIALMYFQDAVGPINSYGVGQADTGISLFDQQAPSNGYQASAPAFDQQGLNRIFKVVSYLT